MCSKYKIVSQEKLSVNHFVHNPFLFIAHHPKWFIDTQITFHSSIFPLTLFYLYGYLCIFLHACQLQIHHSTLHKKVKQTHKHGKVVSIFQCNCRLLARREGDYEILPIMPFCPCLKKLTLFAISTSDSIQNWRYMTYLWFVKASLFIEMRKGRRMKNAFLIFLISSRWEW